MEKKETFGEKLENDQYVLRKGVYAVILNHESQKTATVKTSTGYFLLGGGIEGNDTYEECLKREVLEEIGYEIKVLDFIGRAEKYFYSTILNDYMVSDGFFYLAEIVGEQKNPSEDDHELVWIKRNDVPNLLFLKHQAWAVEKAFRLLV